MNIIGSPDISVLEAKVTWDISGTNPVINLENQSSGSNLANVIWWVVATSPSQTPIHEGSQLSPDMTGVWSTKILTDTWPKPFNSIEWSGAPYSLTLYAQDSLGKVYSINKTASICHPAGNTDDSRSMYGIGTVNLKVECNKGYLFIEDTTNSSYKGITGKQISSSLKVTYPMDSTGTVPAPFSINNFATALVPITFSDPNYSYLSSSVYEYDFSNNAFVRIGYKGRQAFPVYCNYDLCPIACEYAKMIDALQNGSCTDSAKAEKDLLTIGSKFSLALLGLQQPLCGVDVPKLIDEIKEIGGFACDCCSTSNGIPIASGSIIDGFNFSIVTGCGDVNGSVLQTGNNIQFTLNDVSYVFQMFPDSPQSSAFQIIPSISGCTKTYSLKVDVTQFGYDIANAIQSDAGLYNLWNTLFGGSGGSGSNFMLTVDGSCIFTSSAACDYTFTLNNIPAPGTFALVNTIKVGNTTKALNFNVNQTNVSAFQNYLNGLGIGTFTASIIGSTITVNSTANTFDLNNLMYKISTTNYTATLSKNCTGFAPVDAQFVIQQMIYYMCGLTEGNLTTSQDFNLCYLDNNGNLVNEVVVKGTALTSFFTEILYRNCQTLLSVKSTNSVNCNTIKQAFTTNNLQITATDTIMGTKGNGTCSQIAPMDMFAYLLANGPQNATIKQLFCNFVIACSQGLTCAPYDYFNVYVSQYNPTCAPIMGINYSVS